MLIFLDGTALERSAPEKILLFAYGQTEYERNNQSMTYEFCEADADRLIGDFEKSGVDLPVDYHHQSLFASKGGIQAPAAGWITALSKESSGLFAHVKWTDKAKTYLESGEYRYTSPTFYKNKDTGHVAKLVNLALTNIPATSNCPELVAAENIPDLSGGKEHPMKDVLEILGLDAGLEEAAAEAAVKEKLIPLLKQGDWQGAFDYCETHSTLAAKILNAILLTAHEKDEKERQELASEIIDRQVKAILRQINSLAMCGNIAPMLGLLDTVTGMVDAFMGLGSAMTNSENFRSLRENHSSLC